MLKVYEGREGRERERERKKRKVSILG